MQRNKILTISTKARMIATYTLLRTTVGFIDLFVISAMQSFPIILTIDPSVLRIGSQLENLHSLQLISQCIKDLSMILLVMNCDSTSTYRKIRINRILKISVLGKFTYSEACSAFVGDVRFVCILSSDFTDFVKWCCVYPVISVVYMERSKVRFIFRFYAM